MPSNSTLTRLSFQSAGALNVLRYQPVPVGKKPPPAPDGFFLSGGASMLQSCGRSTVRQELSVKEGASAPLGSPSWNFHPESADSSSLGDEPVLPPHKRGQGMPAPHRAQSSSAD